MGELHWPTHGWKKWHARIRRHTHLQRVFALSFFQGGTTSATNERWSVGELTPGAAALDPDTWSLNIFPTAEAQSSAVPIDQQSFLLVRVDYGIGTLADNAYMWVNPDLSLGEPTIGSAQASLLLRNLEFDRLRVGAGGSQNTGALLAASGLFDEIRIGNNFASVIGPGLIPGDVNGDLIVNINDYTHHPQRFPDDLRDTRSRRSKCRWPRELR